MTTLQQPVFRADQHTPYSDPGPWGHLLAAIEPDVASVSAAARNLIVHYREHQTRLPTRTRADIHGRWLARSLERDQERHGTGLTQHRQLTERVQGCCRDHTLFACAVLRQHGIAARGRVGFARYLHPDFCHDHVVVEARVPTAGGRWVRFDPELTGPRGPLETPMDLPIGPDSPFPTAAEVWRGWRAGDLDAQQFGALADSPVRGPWFIQNYVLRDVAHRHGDELLLWDFWGAMAAPSEPLSSPVLALTDQVAALTVDADAGDDAAERALTRLYATATVVGHGTVEESGTGLRPGATVLRRDPFVPHAPSVEEVIS